jgi:stage II sporulation protein AA (anti-sigma F factor antagonist)
MEFQIQKETAATVVAVIGRMDAVTAPEYEKKLAGMMDEGEKNFIIDFGKLDYISSAGLRALLMAGKRVKSLGGLMLLANIGGAVKDVFAISGFGTIFPMHDTVQSALGAAEE